MIPFLDLKAVNAQSADEMKNNCAMFYGTAGPALIESGDLLEFWSDIAPEDIGEASTNEAGRVRERFRLVAYAGELAIERGVLPWEKGSVLKACQNIYQRWCASLSSLSDSERGIANVRAYLMKSGGSRFEQEGYDQRTPNDRAGWFKNDTYHFTPEAFQEACGGVLEREVKRSLRDSGLLHLERPDRLNNRISVTGFNRRVNVVSVKSEICMVEVAEGVEEACGTSD